MPNLKDKSFKKAIYAVSSGILIIILYKTLKLYLLQAMNIYPDQYHPYQMGATVFRIIVFILSMLAITNLYQDPKKELSLARNKHLIPLILSLVAFMGINLLTSELQINIAHFSKELFYNSFTGFAEELCFRGLIFLGLYHIFGLNIAAIFSAALFSAWHFDVNSGALYFIGLFISGVTYALMYYVGVGLIYLSIYHFLWDQTFYGLFLQSQNNNAQLFNTLQMILKLILLGYFIYLARKERKPIQSPF